MNLQEALNWVEELESNVEESENDICLISKLPIRDEHCIELPCGHKFDYEHLHNRHIDKLRKAKFSVHIVETIIQDSFRFMNWTA